MRESNAQFAKAVGEVLHWLDATPETAGTLLGINGRTLGAMCQGIVPMRSLVIRFAGGVAQHMERAGTEGVPGWWREIDAWLELAGYPPRREPHAEEESSHRAAPRFEPPAPHLADPEPPPRAREVYRPVYERRLVGGSLMHIFWIVDRADHRVFEMSMAGDVDYRARAALVKEDLAALSTQQFERKYGRYRLEGR